MISGAERLELQVPPRTSASRDSFDTRPKHVASWLDSLPMANIGETGRLLFATLKEINSFEISPIQRFKVLELFRGPAREVTNALEGYYVGKSFPLPKRNRQIADLAREFILQMAVGYKVIVLELAHEGGLTAPLHRPKLALSVHRAIRYLSRALVSSYQAYSPYPDHVWQEIHSLHNFAARNGFAEKVVSDDEQVLRDKSSTSEAYKQILLLSVSSPYRLRQGDVAEAYAALEQWASHCVLSPIHSKEQRWEGLFAVPSDIDDQPNYMEERKSDTGRMEWVLDTAPLGELLRKQFEYLSNSDEASAARPPPDLPPKMQPELLQRLMRSWGMMLKRRHRRARPEDRRTLEVVFGLSNLHHVLGDEPELELDTKGLEEIELTGLDTGTWSVGVWQAKQHETVHCSVEDEGTGGFRVRWSTQVQSKAQVGEVLGMHQAAPVKEDIWKIGVVRWMRSRSENDLEVGIEKLADECELAAVRVCNAKGECGDPVPSLILPATTAPERPETLVGPVFLANFPNNVLLVARGEENPIRLIKTVEKTGSFAQFEFEMTGAPPKSKLRNRRAEDEEFDSVWKSV